jgi:nitroreductase
MIIKILNKFKTDYFYSRRRLNQLSREELLAILRHDCHRIEKSVYNNIFKSKRKYFEDKLEKVRLIFSILKQKNWYLDEHPVIQWAEQIEHNFYQLEEQFISVNKTEPSARINYEKAKQLVSDFKIRRSCRVWNEKQPTEDELKTFALQMIDAARWAPNSGNRQAWKFSIITEPEKRILLKGLKEKHCYSAPLLIFTGMDSRFYTPAYHLKDCLFIDAGAAIMQMVNIANSAGFGVCWNHFSEDLVKSRKQNIEAYKRFCKELNIPEYVKPVAIVSVGRAKFLPPTPLRLEVSELIIK